MLNSVKMNVIESQYLRAQGDEKFDFLLDDQSNLLESVDEESLKSLMSLDELKNELMI